MNNLFQIREISTLSFNERVLQEAEDIRNPLLERLKFLGIFSSNMDEFFKVRVAAMHRRVEMGKKGADEVLEVIGAKARELDERFRAAYDGIMAGLASHNIRTLRQKDIETHSIELHEWLRQFFVEKVLPHLVPVILQKGQSFPQLTDGALYFGIKMWRSKPIYAILEIPTELPRFVKLPSGDIMYLDDVIRHSLDDIFYIFDYKKITAHEFKISRDADLDMDGDFSEGFLRKMEKLLNQRKGGRAVRLVHDEEMPKGLVQTLKRGLKISGEDTMIPGGRYHNMKDLMQFPNHKPELTFQEMAVARHPVLDRVNTPMLDVIDQQDLLITYPYQSFDHVVRLLREAAIDPKVEQIKMTLYRVSKTSQVVNALINAARNGKKVFVSIELQARFDEENNIIMSERLAEAGVKVVFGVPPMKVHSKLLLITRDSKRYVGLSTGNYNEATGKLYVDSILFSSHDAIGEEVEQIFRYFKDVSKIPTLEPPKFKHLIVSPFNVRKQIMKYLNQEKKKGEEGYVFIKVNHLTDKKIIKLIQDVADAGVKVDLVIRTTYAMHPHPNIRAVSILDRFLEHQRVYIFGKGEKQRLFMSSADLMERNLDWRVEVAFPIYDPGLKQEVFDIMMLQVADSTKARILDEMQTNQYVNMGAGPNRAQNDTHTYFVELFEKSAESK